jgi:hypothetical protein
LNTFDPWPFVTGLKVDESSLTEVQQLLVRYARDIDAHRPKTGFELLQTAIQCAGNGIPTPTWLAQELIVRLATVSGFQVRSLDHPHAFGPVPLKPGAQLKTASVRERWGPSLRLLFMSPGGLPRTNEGFQRAAAMTGLTIKQVRDQVPVTRTHKRSYQTDRKNTTAGGAAHDPFSMLSKMPKR